MRGRTLWRPDPERRRAANISRYLDWLESERRLSFGSYGELWRWSVTELEDFWESVWQYFAISSAGRYRRVLSSRRMPGARWFEGVRLNYAEHVFRNSDPEQRAIVFREEGGSGGALTYSEVQRKVAAFASWLRSVGIGKGDRVAAYLPNIPEGVIAFIACASIGAIWSCCSPDFGAPSVIDRLSQIAPKVLVTAESYTYNGRVVSKGDDVRAVLAKIPSIERVVIVRSANDRQRSFRGRFHDWEETVEEDARLQFEPVPFSHPLWILYSSGTTGPPKAIVHGHGGILLEQHKALSLHGDLTPASKFFWHTSTGWMMWNYLVGGLLLGSTIMLYEGSPSHPSKEVLWELCESEGITFFGTSAAYFSSCAKEGLAPKEVYALEALGGMGSTGSPLTGEGFLWVYRAVKQDLWLASISGGTDLCTAFLGGCPILPVREGELQCACLGAKVSAFDESGSPVFGEMGELVITEPMPSMPVSFWADAGGRKYRESYFTTFPGVWRHGDWIRLWKDGGCVVYGRSDATIKRMGVRIGSSEIYKVLESIPEVRDGLVVSLEYLGSASSMPLFVALRKGAHMSESLGSKIREKIKNELSPRFAPDRIIEVPDIPMTLNGKKVEIPVRRILLGTPAGEAVNPGALKNPETLKIFERLSKSIRQGGS